MATLFDGQDWLARPVDPTGWLADPAREHQVVDGAAIGDDDATAAEETQGRRADDGQGARASGRTARRSGRARHLRRVRTENLRVGTVRAGARLRKGGVGPSAVDQDTGAPDPVELPITQSWAEGYRMGRWARLTLTVTVLAALVVVVVSLTAGSVQRAFVDVTVTPGDTLWSIAAQAAPDRDPRAVIEEIRQLNDMPTGVLPIGVVLRVPVSAD